MEVIFQLIRDERKRQDEKWGTQRSLTAATWLTILVEEVGEVAQEILSSKYNSKDLMEKELIQVAAVVVCWLESMI